MACDFLDWCQGPKGQGCEFERVRRPHDPGYDGFCVPCDIEVRDWAD